MLPHAKALPAWPSAFVTPVLAPASASPVCLFGTSMAPSMAPSVAPLWLTLWPRQEARVRDAFGRYVASPRLTAL